LAVRSRRPWQRRQLWQGRPRTVSSWAKESRSSRRWEEEEEEEEEEGGGCDAEGRRKGGAGRDRPVRRPFRGRREEMAGERKGGEGEEGEEGEVLGGWRERGTSRKEEF
jgi:hypothetical protein